MSEPRFRKLPYDEVVRGIRGGAKPPGRLKAARIGKQYRIAASATGPRRERSLRVETVYDGERATLKIIVLGDLAVGAELLRWVATVAEDPA